MARPRFLRSVLAFRHGLQEGVVLLGHTSCAAGTLHFGAADTLRSAFVKGRGREHPANRTLARVEG